MYKMKSIFRLIAIVIVSLFTTTTYAAFPAQTQQPVEAIAPVQPVAQDYTLSNSIKSTPASAPHNMSGSDVDLVLAILALVFGILSVVVWGGVAAILFGAAAIVLGLMGLERSWRGMSLAGFILGIIGATIGLVSLFD
jgi:hypothetical protein